MAEIGRAVHDFRTALRESNDEQHQAFFAPVLDRIELIVANERDGIAAHLADDLSAARSAIRRLRLPDIDPDLDEPTPALKILRGERGNLVEALDNALDTVKVLGMEPIQGGELKVQRSAFAEQLIRLDERLRVVQDALTDLRTAAVTADTCSGNRGVSQTGLVKPHLQSLTVEVNAARFETRVGNLPGVPEEADLAALARSTEVMWDLARDLKETVDGLSDWVAAGVKLAGGAVAKAAERSWRGMRTVTSVARRRLADPRRQPIPEASALMQAPPHGEPKQDASSRPSDFNIDTVYTMILVGMLPPAEWYPWVTGLDFRVRRLESLSQLSVFTALQTLGISGPLISDLAPLSSLTALRMLYLADTRVADLSPLSGLKAMRVLSLEGSPVSDLSPLVDLKGIQTLVLSGTSVSGLVPLSSLPELRTLDLSYTQATNLAPLATLTNLRSLNARGTDVSDLAPISDLTMLEELDLDNTPVSDVSALHRLKNLQTLKINNTRVSDLSPLNTLPKLREIHVNWSDYNQIAKTFGRSEVVVGRLT
jgi:hypothetical protein